MICVGYWGRGTFSLAESYIIACRRWIGMDISKLLPGYSVMWVCLCIPRHIHWLYNTVMAHTHNNYCYIYQYPSLFPVLSLYALLPFSCKETSVNVFAFSHRWVTVIIISTIQYYFHNTACFSYIPWMNVLSILEKHICPWYERKVKFMKGTRVPVFPFQEQYSWYRTSHLL